MRPPPYDRGAEQFSRIRAFLQMSDNSTTCAVCPGCDMPAQFLIQTRYYPLPGSRSFIACDLCAVCVDLIPIDARLRTLVEIKLLMLAGPRRHTGNRR